jgi:prepilin-type N-terminal cleavage/methylation domain-containing protein
MTNTIRHMNKRDEAFTLIELMIVMIVLGILAAIVIFAVDPFEDSANDAATDANAKQCKTAQAAFIAEDGATPFADYFDGGAVPAGCVAPALP